MTDRHPMLVYTGLRLLIFAVPFALLMALGIELVWALLVAALVSSIASIFVLSRFRERLSISLVERNERAHARAKERERAEDAWDDAQRDGSEGVEPPESDLGDNQ